MADLANILLSDNALRFVGVEVRFEQSSGEGNPVDVLGSLALRGEVTVCRPAPTPAAYAYFGAASSAPGVGRKTFALTPSPTALSGLSAGMTKAGPAVSRLVAMRKSSRDAYPLYDAIDALIEAVIELNRRGA